MSSGSDRPSPNRRRSRRNWARLLGDLLLVAGAVSLALAGLAYFTDPSRAELSLPRPVALAGAPEVALEDPTAIPPTDTAVPPTAEPTRPAATALPTSTPTVTPTPTATPIPAGVPDRLVISALKIDSEVKEIGTSVQNGELIWETIPFIVGHYRTTAQAGEEGNAIFAGHVASRNWGNVFLNLYKIKLGDEVEVYTEQAVFTYVVNRVRLVLPTQTDVMNPTPDATITLITCGGDWLPDERNYSHRLIVNGKLVSAKPKGS